MSLKFMMCQMGKDQGIVIEEKRKEFSAFPALEGHYEKVNVAHIGRMSWGRPGKERATILPVEGIICPKASILEKMTISYWEL